MKTSLHQGTLVEILLVISPMERKKSPRVLGLSPDMTEAYLQHILLDCFEYDITQRPHANDTVDALLH